MNSTQVVQIVNTGQELGIPACPASSEREGGGLTGIEIQESNRIDMTKREGRASWGEQETQQGQGGLDSVVVHDR